ncbi:MAG: hypothetical protein UH239_03625 [Acutalibacteraceae bacterium]|nr:hypothetical protein [Acutalibacteraceae bacterium]
MNTTKRFITVILIITVTFLMFGCTTRQIITTADELTINKWSSSDKFNKEISLEFSENNATLSFKTENFSGKISGLAIIDDKTITINDKTLNQDFSFEYELFGDKINLKYKDNMLELEKVAVENSQK